MFLCVAAKKGTHSNGTLILVTAADAIFFRILPNMLQFCLIFPIKSQIFLNTFRPVLDNVDTPESLLTDLPPQKYSSPWVSHDYWGLEFLQGDINELLFTCVWVHLCMTWHKMYLFAMKGQFLTKYWKKIHFALNRMWRYQSRSFQSS